jgi:Zn-dependent M28 family amino/carboxypeptidase
MLIRSLGTADFRLPHTGALRYDDDAPRIPSAAIATEDADQLVRLIESGEPVRVRMRMNHRTLPDATSHNVIGEIRGRERPEEVVLIGAHLDSWDAGCGAHDDGAGVVAVMESLRILAAMDRAPRRTVRGVLFTNEENGLRGGRDYAERYSDVVHVSAAEMDSGGFPPRGYGISAGEGAVEMLEGILAPLAAIGANEAFGRGGGADIGPLRKFGTPMLAHVVDTERYFDYHHTAADTLDKVDPVELRKNVAAMAWVAWALAESQETLPRLPVEPDESDGTR